MSWLDRIHAAAAGGALDDEALRAHAEELTARGDPRGRFIALQCDRARSGEWPTDEERALLGDHWRAWIGAPSRIVPYTGVEMARGFWTACTFFDHRTVDAIGPTDRTRIAEDPAWSTVERLAIPYFVPNDLMTAIVGGAIHRSLRSLTVGTASALGAMASWTGPMLRLRKLTFRDDRDPDAPLPSSFPALEGLACFGVYLLADSGADVFRTMAWLGDGPAGPEGRVAEIELGVFPHPRYDGHDGPATFERLVAACRSPILRAVQLDDAIAHTVRVERDAPGPWTRQRVIFRRAWAQNHLPVGDVQRLAGFVRRLPRGTLGRTVVEVPVLDDEPDAAAALDRLAMELARDGGAIERTPRPPKHPPEISPPNDPT